MLNACGACSASLFIYRLGKYANFSIAKHPPLVSSHNLNLRLCCEAVLYPCTSLLLQKASIARGSIDIGVVVVTISLYVYIAMIYLVFEGATSCFLRSIFARRPSSNV